MTTAPGTACAREGCGHDKDEHVGLGLGGRDSCSEWCGWCGCPAYLAPTPCAGCGHAVEYADDGMVIEPYQPAPTPTADDLPVSVFPSRAGEDTDDLAAPSLGERDDAADQWREPLAREVERLRAEFDAEKDRADAAEERARTAEAEVERLRKHELCDERWRTERDAARAEVKALGERIALAIEAECLTARHANGIVCRYCRGAAHIARETTP